MRSCQQLEDFILDYLDGDLQPRQEIVFKLHLKLCRECRDHLAAYCYTIDVTKLVAISGGPSHLDAFMSLESLEQAARSKLDNRQRR